MHTPQAKDFSHELIFITSRSGGPGGQNVNKVNSRVTLKLELLHSSVLNDDQKLILLKRLNARITKDAVLVLTAQDQRSQLQNKEAVLLKLDRLLTKVLTPQKSRKATKPSKASKQARIKEKKHRAEKKQWRQKM